MDSVPFEKRVIASQSLELGNSLLMESALEIRWLVSNYTPSFRISMEDTSLTRREILSTISSAFDPLGLVSPFVLKGRNILQKITADSYSWDDNVTSEQRSSWEE